MCIPGNKPVGCSLKSTSKGRAGQSLTCAVLVLVWHAVMGRALPKESLTEGWLKPGIRSASMEPALSCANGEQSATHSGHAPDTALTSRASAQETQREFSGGQSGHCVISLNHSRGDECKADSPCLSSSLWSRNNHSRQAYAKIGSSETPGHMKHKG